MSYDIQKLVENVVAKAMNENRSAIERPKMTLALARQLVEKVELKAQEMGLRVVVAIADAGANIVTVDSMDGAYIASLDIAMNKTFTAVSLKMPTTKVAELAQPGAPLYGIQHTNNGKIVIFGGGEPLIADGEVIGGLGVSGGSLEEDIFLGQYGRQVFEELLK